MGISLNQLEEDEQIVEITMPLQIRPMYEVMMNLHVMGNHSTESTVTTISLRWPLAPLLKARICVEGGNVCNLSEMCRCGQLQKKPATAAAASSSSASSSSMASSAPLCGTKLIGVIGDAEPKEGEDNTVIENYLNKVTAFLFPMKHQ